MLARVTGEEHLISGHNQYLCFFHVAKSAGLQYNKVQEQRICCWRNGGYNFGAFF